MRAVIAKTFAAYSFAAVDTLDMDDLVDIYTAAQWLGEQEARQAKAARTKRRRR